MPSDAKSSTRAHANATAAMLILGALGWVSPAAAHPPQPGHAYRLELRDSPGHCLTLGARGRIVRGSENNADRRQFFVLDREGGEYRIKTVQTSRFENRYLAIQGDGSLRAERFELAAPRQRFALEQHGDWFALVEGANGQYLDVASTTGWVGRRAGENGKPKTNQQFKLVDETRISQVNNPPTDWMRGLSDTRTLASLSIPGTHDSGARKGFPFVRCQHLTIADQLALGVRFLDIRVRAMKRNSGALDIYHGPAYVGLSFETVLAECKAFLDAHPTECIIMRVAKEHAAEDGAADAATILSRVLRANGPLFYTSDTLPTLGRARGRIVLMSDSGGRSVRTGGLFHSDNGSVSLEGDRPGGGNSWTIYGAGDTGIHAFFQYKWERIKTANTDEPHKLRFVYISGTGFGQGGMFPSTVAKFMNPAVFERMQGPGYSGRYRYGVIVTDFAPSGIIDLLIHSNFDP